MDTFDIDDQGKKEPDDKVSFQEIALLTGSLLCFIAAIVCLLQKSFLFSIIFITLHGCLVLIFLLVNHKRHLMNELFATPKEELPSPTQNTLELMERDNALITSLRQEKEHLSYENEKLSDELDKVKAQAESLTQLLAEAELKSVAALDPDVASSILPPKEEVTDLDLVSLSQGIVNQLQPQCAAAGIRLELSTSSEYLPYQADKRYMEMVVRNIIDNSIKYMQQNGNLVITISNVGTNIFIAFKDNGRGLPEKEMPNIFDLNFQGSNRVSGNGLGLAQVKAIVEHYNGKIYAHSSNGMGIYIQLPVHS